MPAERLLPGHVNRLQEDVERLKRDQRQLMLAIKSRESQGEHAGQLWQDAIQNRRRLQSCYRTLSRHYRHRRILFSALAWCLLGGGLVIILVV